MDITVLDGHLTPGNKKAIKAILEQSLTAGKVGKASYFLTAEGSNVYKVAIQVMDRGLIPVPGSKLRLSTYTSKIKIK